jgi:2-methylcitrate dehydratase PrpD
VQLAAEGAYASRTAIDGEAGILAAFHKSLQPGVPELFADRPEILAVFFKPVPACNFAQSPAQAALAIAKRKHLRAADVERVTVHVTRAAALYPGCNVSGPFEHILQAKMSIHYNVAAALLHGDTAERNYVPQQNPDVLKVATLVRLDIDTDLTKAFPAKQGAGVTVHTRAGDVLEERVDDVVPTDASGVRERFVAAAAERLGQKRAKELDRAIATLETVADAAELARLATLDPS